MCRCHLIFNNELSVNNEKGGEVNRFYELIPNLTIEEHLVQENKIIPSLCLYAI